MIEQPNLFAVRDHDLAAKYEHDVIQLLQDGLWWYRRDIVSKIPALNERAVRAIADRNRRLIVSGNKGYCLLRKASVEDVHKAISRLLATAKDLQRDVLVYEKEINRRRDRSGRAA
jgi:hypothetical protein